MGPDQDTIGGRDADMGARAGQIRPPKVIRAFGGTAIKP
jgi:hypothetical protein